MKTNSRIFIIALFLTTIIMSGCSNTLEGVGRDMKHAGEWVEKTF